MKRIIGLTIFTLATMINYGCDSILEETPQSQVVPSFFNSSAGVLGGISGVYNDLRSQ
jgi:hypothetical protein